VTSLKLFSRHLKRRKRMLAVLFLLGLVGSATALSTPLLGKAFIDAVVERGDFGLIPIIALALVGLAVADVAIGFASRWLHARLSAGVLVEIRQRLFSHCLYARMEKLEQFRHGDLLSRFGTDIPKIQALLVDGVTGLFHNLVFLLVSAAILVYLSPLLALWSYVGLVAALILTAVFRKPIETGTRGIRLKMADLSHFLSERLGALRSIRFHNTQTQELQAFGELNEQLVRRVIRFQLTDSAASQLPGLALAASLAWIYVLGGGLLQSGTIGLGTFVAFVLYQGRLYAPAAGLLGLYKTLQQVQVSLERVAEVLGGEECDERMEFRAMHGPGERRAAALELEDVNFTYGDEAPVLDHLSLKLGYGEKVAVFGASGVGKSTLIQLIFGLREAQGGRVRVAAREPAPNTRALLGYATADPFLLHASVRENLCYGSPGANQEAILDAVRLAEAHRFILSLPQGFDTVIGGRGQRLSDGQRQRLGLARLFLASPQILVLDEAFSALDATTESRVRANLFEAFADRAILVISHRLGGLEQFDRLLLMSGGRLHPVSADELHTRFRQPGPQPA